MPQERLSMRKIRDVLRYRNDTDLSLEAIARALRLSKGVVSKYLKLAENAGLKWPLPDDLDDGALEHRLYRQLAARESAFVEPDHALIHQELKKKGVTLTLLWEEYKQEAGETAYQYTAFCTRYRAWAGSLKRSMRQIHRAGEKLFADFAGPTVAIFDADTGESRVASIFVAVLGASSYTFACATAGQTQADWLGGLARALEFIGGVTELIVPDNPKALVKVANAYEPELNRATAEFAQHYGTVILPARPKKPQDKAKVEVGVQVVERWILARLRHRQFFSLVELDSAVGELLPVLNDRPFKKLPGSRREAFERLDVACLKALPTTRFELADWKRARVNIDYHVEFEGHFYSVPHVLARQEVELRITQGMVEILARNRRVAGHARNTSKGNYTTVAEHMPAAHRAHAEWTPGKLIAWGTLVGVATGELVQRMLLEKQHSEQGYRACLGLMRLARKVGAERMEAACTRALAIGAYRFRSVASILDKGLDRQPVDPTKTDTPLHSHANVRGPDYYH
ncbi:IS21 family transposase [Candidatus Symbiobacter mobilis]|uniref:Transposase n=1 Tax=Candidatus Symbiobacter mobilis CR TaxID=946483 RepID=U5N891_9BURK|nr:IS21 family transposase [Candidatus Symbiobacter mobilis]AGX86199.1 transposase [Candidatus Symbiobacter mobilis CR]AGX86379.1 transposase [Candidatus Symbiobacter mobilis CR]AGX88046.1 transposase [Candidatus Symbiobacter mobilis CR]